MQQLIDFFQGNGTVLILAAFVFLSAVLTAIAKLLEAAGKAVPGWMGTAISGLGSVISFLNGNIKPKA